MLEKPFKYVLLIIYIKSIQVRETLTTNKVIFLHIFYGLVHFASLYFGYKCKDIILFNKQKLDLCIENGLFCCYEKAVRFISNNLPFLLDIIRRRISDQLARSKANGNGSYRHRTLFG